MDLDRPAVGGPGDLSQALAELAAAVIRRRPRQISLTTASVLSALEGGGPARLGELAAGEGIAQPSMSALVDQLERMGLAARQHDPSDGRGVLVTITEEGRAWRAARRRALASTIESALDGLPPTDRSALESVRPALARLIDGLNLTSPADIAGVSP